MSSLTILTLAIIAAANMAVGGCIGICGIAGFLLPMLYTGGLGFDVTYALALSFLAFLVSGIIGSFNYYKAGNLEVRMSLKLGIGSLIGAIAGVFLQSMIEKSTAKTILYLVVLFSGASILVRMWNEKRKADSVSAKKVISDGKKSASSNPSHPKSIADHMGFLIFLGITTGAICSLSGAGGPVLVMPLLVACGVSARIAVGVALFDSVFIAIPACIQSYLDRNPGTSGADRSDSRNWRMAWKPVCRKSSGSGSENICSRFLCLHRNLYAGIKYCKLSFFVASF